jgi:aspartate ammonia-lyase
VQLRLYPDLIKPLAMVKLAAARANYDCGALHKTIQQGIEGACHEIIDGKLHDQFRLDVFQGDAGTSTNMNANEVIANRALELMGHEKVEYQFCDPHDHVNASQSTNDAYPTALCTDHLAAVSALPLYLASDLIEATQDTQSFVLYSSCMKSLAIKLSKICNDLRLLSSGPRCGLREINLPPKQPGSSIMPGKVNPGIPEVVNMVCFRVIGSDLTVTMAAEAGHLQLNVFEPVIAACIFEAQTMFINAARTLRLECVGGITANPRSCAITSTSASGQSPH